MDVPAHTVLADAELPTIGIGCTVTVCVDVAEHPKLVPVTV